MEAFLLSVGIVALAEIGDKTQLLALVLAAKFRKPWPIVLGILVATLVNHAFAGVVGAWIARTVDPTYMRWILGLSFVAMAAWTLVPDKYEEAPEKQRRFGVFLTTLCAFFLVEMGDKTQIATVALAAKYPSLLAVVAGTTAGMMLANAPGPARRRRCQKTSTEDRPHGRRSDLPCDGGGGAALALGPGGFEVGVAVELAFVEAF